MLLLKNLLTASLILIFIPVFSQNKVTISGFVYESESKETLPGAVVATADMAYGSASNAFGFYTLTVPASEKIILVYQLVGYEKLVIEVNGMNSIQKDVYLSNAASLGEVVIEADKVEKISEDSRMSTIEIPIEQIKKIPALLGEKDVLKVIQLMPGVQKGSEGSSGFYVRGGGPDQNLIILDDATVYNANHLFGFFSIFNGDALKSVELVKGGFPARYGGRLSSVLELRMKDGNKEKFKTEFGVGLVSSRVLIEGPVKKGKSSFLISGRRTYIDLLIYPLLPADSKGGYFFHDFNAKYNHVINDKNRIYVSGYFGKDKFYVRPKTSVGSEKGNFLWGNATATVRWNNIINEKTFGNLSAIFTNYKFGINFQSESSDGDKTELDFQSGIRDYSLKYDVDYQPNPNHYIRVGAVSTNHIFTPSATVLKNSSSDVNYDRKQTIYTGEGALYAEDDWGITDKLKVNFGLRYSIYNHKEKYFNRLEPRFSGRYMIKPSLSFKASYALMNQYIHLLSNTGIGLPTDLWVPATNRVQPQQSQQFAAGFAKDLSKQKLLISIEGYYKKMDKVIAYKEGASFLDTGFAVDEDANSWQDKVTDGQGWSYGGELLVQRKFGKLTGWVGYTLSWTQLQFDELNFGKKFYARYDRRHDLSVVAIYEINEKVTLSATWVYGTGQAITLPNSSYVVDGNMPGGANFGFGGSNTFSVENYGEKNSFRMAPYHRGDIAASFLKKKKNFERTIEIGLYNAYNRQNPFYYFTDTDVTGNTKLKQISLFPIIPSISWNYKF